MFQSPGEVAFQIGPFSVYWYGIIISFAFITGIWVSSAFAKIKNENPENILDMAIYLLIGAVIFSRLYFVIFSWDYFKNNIQEAFMIWQGGLSIHGAMIGGCLVLVLYSILKKLCLLKYADLLCLGFVLGQAIGRWGNFFNSEAFGKPTDLFWKVYIPPEKRPYAYIDKEFFHPAFLYESLWNFIVFFILVFLLKKFKNCNGILLFSYLILYSIGRFFIEDIRIDSIYSVFGLPVAQFASLIMIFVGVAGFLFLYSTKK